MLCPTCKDLLNIVNESKSNKDERISSKYTIILGVARRSRQIVDEENETGEFLDKNALTVSIEDFEDRIVSLEKTE